MYLVDSNVWIASKREKDELHEKGKKIIEKILSGEFGKVAITDYIIDEVITYLNVRDGFSVANEMLEDMENSDLIEMIFVDTLHFEKSKEIFKKYKILSFTDATCICVIEEKKLDGIISFDKDFDIVKGIKRMED